MTVVMQPAERRPVPALGAFIEGWRRVLHAPVLVLGTAVAVGLAVFLLETVYARAYQLQLVTAIMPGGNTAWGYTIQSLYLETRVLVGVVAPELARFFELGLVSTSWMASDTLRTAFLLFLSGGILDRLARGRPVRSAAFFAACGVYFVRFIRLMLIMAVPAWALLQVQQALAGSFVAHMAILLVVLAAAVVIDFARARAVVEDRLSMLAAIAGGWRFVRRRPWRVLALTLLNALTMLAVLRLQVQIVTVPSPDWLALPLAALITLLAVSARLAMMASQVVFFQGELAHAGYTAAPLPQWPDSPAVEALGRLTGSKGERVKG